MVEGTYENVLKIWRQHIPTNPSVVGTETFINRDLNANTNITIDYSVNVPYKKGVADQALLPIRISYWFTNTSGHCFNQDKANSNRAETPFCMPLIAEYLGPNNGTTSFRVELHPDLPDGTYEVVRSIDIDPPVNGEIVWINYGREIIGTVSVVNKLLSTETSELATPEIEIVEAKAPEVPLLNKVTGRIAKDLIGNNSAFTVIGLFIVCAMITIISVTFLRRNK